MRTPPGTSQPSGGAPSSAKKASDALLDALDADDAAQLELELDCCGSACMSSWPRPGRRRAPHGVGPDDGQAHRLSRKARQSGLLAVHADRVAGEQEV